MGVCILIYIINLRLDAILYARAVNSIRKYFYDNSVIDIAKNIKRTWHTTQLHLFKLRAENKIKFKKVGRQNQFWLNKKYEKEFE